MNILADGSDWRMEEKRLKRLGSIFVLAVSTVFLMTATTPSAVRASESGVPTRQEIVVIGGDILETLFSTPLEHLSLYAVGTTGFEPIPFQIDERYRKGNRLEYAYTGGPKATSDPDPTLDGDDELVFWSGDVGPRAEGKEIEGARYIELKVEDPVSGMTGYVYLMAFDGRAPRSDRRYVTYDPKTDSVSSLYYKLDYREDSSLGFDDFSITQAAGGSGEDFVDETKYRIHVNMAGPLIQYDLTNQEAHIKVKAWIDGPVRVKRVARSYIEMWVWLGSTSRIVNTYTPTGFAVEVPIIGPFPTKGIAGTKARWSLELNESAIGMTFKSADNPDGVTIDGEESEAEKDMDYSPNQWMLITGKPGTFIRRAGRVSPRTLYLDMYYLDRADLNEEGEYGPGQIGASGYYIHDTGKRGFKYNENIVDYYEVLPSYVDGDENGFIEREENPLRVSSGGEAVANAASMGPAKWPAPKKPRKDQPSPSCQYVGAQAPKTERQVVPIVMASSDSGAGGGVGYMDTNLFGTGLRVGTLLIYTSKSYIINEIAMGSKEPRGGGDWAWYGYLGYHKRPVKDFYGLTNDSDRGDRTNFSEEREKIIAWGMRRLWGPFWIGGYFEPIHEYIGDGEGDSSPNTFDEDYFPDLLGKGQFWTNRVGGFMIMDTRDNYDNPTKGGFRMIEYYSVPEWMGNDFTFEYWTLDLKQFISLRPNRKDVLALRLQAQHAEGGSIPFYELSVAGSERTLRGYYDGRWRDRDMIVLNTELRHNLWKTFDLNFYYDIGRVYGDMFQEGEHLLADLREAYGFGMRIQVPPDLVLRFDLGFSNTDSVFYLNFGQTF